MPQDSSDTEARPQRMGGTQPDGQGMVGVPGGRTESGLLEGYGPSSGGTVYVWDPHECPSKPGELWKTLATRCLVPTRPPGKTSHPYLKDACRAELWSQALGQRAFPRPTPAGWLSLVRGYPARAHRLGQLQRTDPRGFKSKPDSGQLSLRFSGEQSCWSTGTRMHTGVLCQLTQGHHSREGGQCWDVALGRPVTSVLKASGTEGRDTHRG